MLSAQIPKFKNKANKIHNCCHLKAYSPMGPYKYALQDTANPNPDAKVLITMPQCVMKIGQ